MFFNDEPSYFMPGKGIPANNEINFEMIKSWRIDPNNPAESAVALLHRAAYMRKLEVLKQGIAAGIPLNAVSSTGTTLFSEAIRGNSVDVINYLFEIGLNPTYMNKQSNPRSAFHLACLRGIPELVEQFLAHSAISIDMPDAEQKQSGLQLAISAYEFKLAARMLELGASPSFVDGRRRTPLAIALSYFCLGGPAFGNPKTERDLERLCVQLMKAESPFTPINETARAAIEVILYPHLAFSARQAEAQEIPTAGEVLMRFHHCNPKFLHHLENLANQNPHGKNEKMFLEAYLPIKTNKIDVPNFLNRR